jgi:chloride channel 3/4/5
MNPYRTGKLVLFQVTYDRDWHFFEILFFVVLGIFGVSLFLIVMVLNLLTFRRVFTEHSLSSSISR